MIILAKFEIKEPVFEGLVYWGVIGIVIVVLAVVMRKLLSVFPDKKWNLYTGVLLLLAVPAVLAKLGWLTNQDVRPSPFIMIPVTIIVASFGIAFSRFGKRLSIEVSVFLLVAIQMFRFPLELVMHQAFERGIMPKMLSFEGLNFDILTGIGALLIVSIWKLRGAVSEKIIWVWNVYGLGCLFMIFYIAIRSSPILRGWGDEPENVNTWVLFFPYIWLPTFLVVAAFSGHLILTRKLLNRD